MKPKILSSIGLVLGIFGVFMLFKWGPPQPSFETGIGIGLEDNTPVNQTGKTVAQHNREIKEKEELYSGRSKQGLGLIALGFIFQLLSVWVDDLFGFFLNIFTVIRKKIKINPNTHDRNSNNKETRNNQNGMVEARISDYSDPKESAKDDKRA